MLVVEDDELLLRALSRRLSLAGYTPHHASTAGRALELMSELDVVDCVLVDLNLPDLDGFALLERLRRISDVPVIIVSVSQSEDDKIRALDGGADDYVTKPLHGGELLARIRAALRRHQGLEREPLRFAGGIVVDVVARSVTVDGEPVSLTRTEWSLLEQLLARPGVLLPHEELLRRVWGVGFAGDSHYVRVYVASLRRKLGDDARDPRLIGTQQGVGYRWLAEPID